MNSRWVILVGARRDLREEVAEDSSIGQRNEWIVLFFLCAYMGDLKTKKPQWQVIIK